MALIKPTIYADLVREKYEGKAIMRNFAVDAGELQNTTVGVTVSFSKWGNITDAEDMTNFTNDDELTSVSLSQTADTATVKQIGKAIFVRDYDNVTALGNAIDEAAVQHGIVISRKVDADLAAEALTTALKYQAATPTAITATELNSTIGLFGDEQGVEEFAGIVINSLLLPSFRSMTEFVDMNKSTTTVGNGIIRRGLVGFFNGIPVYLSNKGTYDSALSETITYVIKVGALAYMEKRAIMIEEDRRPKAGGSDLVANLIYSVKLVKNDGIAILRKTIA